MRRSRLLLGAGALALLGLAGLLLLSLRPRPAVTRIRLGTAGYQTVEELKPDGLLDRLRHRLPW